MPSVPNCRKTAVLAPWRNGGRTAAPPASTWIRVHGPSLTFTWVVNPVNRLSRAISRRLSVTSPGADCGEPTETRSSIATGFRIQSTICCPLTILTSGLERA